MKKVDIKTYIDFDNKKMVDLPKLNYEDYRMLKTCVNNTIIDYEKRENKNNDTLSKLYALDKILLIICTNRIEKENIPLSEEYINILSKVGL